MKLKINWVKFDWFAWGFLAGTFVVLIMTLLIL